MRERGLGIGDWGRWGPLWGTRGPHSPKGVGIRGEGVMGIEDKGSHCVARVSRVVARGVDKEDKEELFKKS
ncbi:hypothetical protein AMR41_04025 [Hapalosiphon sp. MRB220]|nr:hypothetical protein AMR41_04025 [Hapalosiphon sp. MRB220]